MKIFSYITGPIQVNTYLVYDENTMKGFIVDPGDYSPKLSKMAMDLGIDIEYIILTHGHGDHIGGVERFKRDFSSAKLVAHEKEKEMLSDAVMNCSAEFFPGGDQRALINSIKDRLFHLPDDTRVLPGHMGETTIGEEKKGNPFV